MELPLIVTKKNKYFTGALMFALSYTIYYLTNHHPVFTPVELPMSWIDQMTPLIPWTVVIYMSEYFYFAFVYILLKNTRNLSMYLYSFFSLQVFACIIFFFYPTTFPRANYPIPNDIAPWLMGMWKWLHTVDAPTNCFPSLHVSSVYLSAFAFRTDGQPRTFWVFFIWSTAIATTTLTTKQHYIADVIFGIILAVCFYLWFHHKQTYRNSILSQGT